MKTKRRARCAEIKELPINEGKRFAMPLRKEGLDCES